MAQRTTDELRVFLEGSIDQYNALTNKAGTVFFDKYNHAVYAKGECIIQSNIKDVTYNESSTELTIIPFTGSKITINLGIQKELDLLKDNLEDWVADNFASTTILSTELDKKVDKVSGKGLSTNDYTTDEKNKLAGIAEGAQVNKISSFKANNTEVGGTGNKVEVSLAGNLVDSTNAATGSVKFNLSHKYVAADKKIYFFNSATAPTVGTTGNIFSIDTTDFVKDGMLANAKYDENTHVLTLTFNATATDSGAEDIEVDLSKLVDVYKAGGGLTLSNDGTFNVNYGYGLAIDSESQELIVDIGNGLTIDTSNDKITLKLSNNSGLAITPNGIEINYGHGLDIDTDNNELFVDIDTNNGLKWVNNKIGVDFTKAPVQSVNGQTGAVDIDVTPKVWSF